MKELQKTAEEFIDFLDTYIEDRSTPITPQTLEERGFKREERLIRIVCTKGDDPDHQVSVSFRHDGRLDAVEVTDWPRSHACIRETITTVEQLNQLLNLMHMEAIMNAQLTLDDFPGDRANCATCTRKGGACPRREKRYPNGYVKSSVNGDFTGIIYRCPNYTGQYENKK